MALNKLKKLFGGLLSLALALAGLGSGAWAQVRVRVPVVPVPYGAPASGLPGLAPLPSAGALSELSALSGLQSLPALPQAPLAAASEALGSKARFPVSSVPGTEEQDWALVRYFERMYKQEGSVTIVSDLDDTLSDNSNGKGTPISGELAQTIARLQAKGNRFILNTNRPFRLPNGNGAYELFAERLPQSARAGLMMATNSGAEVWVFGPNGETPEKPAWLAAGFSRQERSDVERIVGAALAGEGLSAADADFQLKDHQAVIVLKGGREKLPALAGAIRAALASGGLAFNVIEKQPHNPANPPYIVVSSMDKATNTKGIRELLAAQGVTPKPSAVLLNGDDFDVPGFDTAMQRGWPGALSLSVGHKVSGKLSKTYLYSKAGHESSLEFLKRLADALDAL